MKPKMKTLKNGLRIVTLAMPENPTVTVLAMVEAGTRYETAKTNGLSHFLEHMCFKGTHKRANTQIAYELESIGAETNAFTWYDYTGYHAKARAAMFPKLLDIVSDVYLNSTIPEAELEKERGVIMGEIDMYEDMPKFDAAHLFNKSLYGDQPLGWTVLGPKENIRTFTQKDFLDYRNAHYVASKTTIVVVGNIDEKSVVAQVTEAFKSIPARPRIRKKPVSKTEGDSVIVKTKKTDQTHIVLGTRSVAVDHADADAMHILTGLLGQGMSSRLFLKLREEMGAGYYVKAGEFESDDIGDVTIATGTEPRRAGEIITAILGELETIRTQVPPEPELAKVKEYLAGMLYMSNESTDAIAYHLGTQAVLHQPLRMPRDIERDLRKVTAKDVVRAAKKYLKPERLHLAIIGPHENAAEFKSILK